MNNVYFNRKELKSVCWNPREGDSLLEILTLVLGGIQKLAFGTKIRLKH